MNLMMQSFIGRQDTIMNLQSAETYSPVSEEIHRVVDNAKLRLKWHDRHSITSVGFPDWNDLSPTGLTQLLGHVEMPERFFDHLNDEELHDHAARTINLLLENKNKAVMMRRIRTGFGGVITAILSPSYFRINNDFVVDTLEKAGITVDSHGLAGNDEFQVKRNTNTPDRLHVRLLSRGVETGDIGIGVDITNSETGLAALNVSPFVYVLACSNGMIIKQQELGGMRKIHRTARADFGFLPDPDLTEWRYREIAEDIIVRINAANDEKFLLEIQSKIDDSKKITEPKQIDKLENRIKAILNKPEKLMYTDFYRPIEPGNAWGSIQALTAMAHTEETIENTPRQSELETRAWDFLDRALIDAVL